MLRRKAEERLLRWKQTDRRKCLMVRGARQIGKTSTVEAFGKEHYRSLIELNFIRSPGLKAIFSGDLDPETLRLNLSVYLPGAKIIPGETLLFLDEIQECPEAVTSLKFLAQDRSVDVIASGSMLGVDYKRPSSYPVGSVDYYDMTALDFEEFLWAAEVPEEVTNLLRGCCAERKKVPDAIHVKMMEYLCQYLVVGGMPEAAAIFFEENSLSAADEKLRAILTDYRYDIAHYAAPDEKLKAEMCYFSIPDQLAKDNHKFQYSVVEKGSNARKYRTSIDWLQSADLITRCHNVKSMQMPLRSAREDLNYRVYPTDIGLLVSMFEVETKQQLLADTLGTAKGGIYEALAAELLWKSGVRDLYFRKNEQATFEIEFLLEQPDGIIPVEVKAGRSRSRSLDRLLEKDEIPYGYKLTSGNVGVSGKKITLPLYMAGWIYPTPSAQALS